MMIRVRSPHVPDSNCITTIIDSQHGDKMFQKPSDPNLASSIHRSSQDSVDCIILVYDLERSETFFRLENHWLPLIERHYQGDVSA
jgi:mitochondrial Rho GTPase 1